MNKKLQTIVKLAVVAALYVVLTLINPLSWGEVQFRISELLMILVLFNKKYSISLILGCLIANIISPIGLIDMLFGTLGTATACVFMMFYKNKYISLLGAPICNCIFVGLELMLFYEVPFVPAFIGVFVGEFVVVYILGLLFLLATKNATAFNKLLKEV